MAHKFGVLGGFAWPARLSMYFRVNYEQNLVFLCFMAIFMSYSPQFWGSLVIYNDRRARYMFESDDQKLDFFVSYGRFHGLFPTSLGFQGDFHGP
jgi:hypothetical protein